jgi:OOP family OmpA-OmpF porin
MAQLTSEKNMKKNILIALVAAAVLAPVAAQAQSYIGANVGRSEQKVSIEEGSVKDNATAFKLYGGYQFTPIFGIEGGIANLGKAEISGNGASATAKPRSIYVAATGTWQLQERLALTAKVGAASSRTTVSAAVAGFGVESEKVKNSTAIFGIGAAYSITPTVLAVAEYENFGKIVDEDGINLKANVLSVGIRVKF